MAIINFEEITFELNDYEHTVLLPLIILGLKTKIGKENVITNKDAVSKLKERGCKISGVRFRKIVQYIRINNLIFNLVSTSNGYFIATTEEQRLNYMKSLQQRIQSITSTYDAMENQHLKTTK